METSSLSCKKATHHPARTPPPPASLMSPVTEVVAKDMGSAMSNAAVVVGGLEDDKDRIVVEIMQMYSKQQEKLNSTLHKQLQLEMVSLQSERTKTEINELLTRPKLSSPIKSVLDVDVEVMFTSHRPLHPTAWKSQHSN